MVTSTLRSSLEDLATQLGNAIPGTDMAAELAGRLASAAPGETVGEAADQAAQVVSGVPVVGKASGAVRESGRAVHAAQVLVEAGVIRLERPDEALAAARALAEWKMTPAAGFVVSAIRYPEEPALIDEIGTLTFEEVHRRTNALAHSLAEEGVEAGHGVAIMCRDHRGFIEATVALSKLGATALYFNTQFAGPQLEEVVEREEPTGIIFDQEFAEVLEDAASDLNRWVAWRDEDEQGDETTLEELIEGGDESDLPAPDEIGKTILLTSGSTGTPKGASRGQPSPTEPVVALMSRIPLKAREHTMMAAPLFHAWGFLHFQIGLILSSTYVLRRRFDPEGTLAAIDEHDATTLVIVPIMMSRILELDDETRGKYDTSSLRIVAASGGALSGDLAEKWMDEYGDNLYNLYGSTEVAWAAIADPEDLRAAPGTSGPTPPGTSIKIVDEDGNEVSQGETGEIHVGNAMLFEGYTGGGSEEMVDGHMATGDLGYLDDEGRLFVEGRSDEMIVSGGENVYPEEVEKTLEQHDSVSEAAVVGVEDDEYGERLKAYIVKDGEVSEDDLKSHVKENLAKFKVPRDFVFRDEELPRNPQGKVQKDQLEEEEGDEESGGEDEGSGGQDEDSGGEDEGSSGEGEASGGDEEGSGGEDGSDEEDGSGDQDGSDGQSG